jgi:hypothetical protein
LWAAIKEADRRHQTCHRVANDLDVLIAEAPRLHFRCPDVSVASGCLLVLEIVSADSVTTDIRDKRAEYAAAGIPQYWIARMTANDGPAISVERFVLSADGVYISLGWPSVAGTSALSMSPTRSGCRSPGNSSTTACRGLRSVAGCGRHAK